MARRFDNLQCLAMIVWGVACLFIITHAYLHPNTHSVFRIYAIASHGWWAGTDMFGIQPETKELYRYSPIFAVLTSPFAFLPIGVGNAAWKFANTGVFGVGLWVWCRRALPVQVTTKQFAGVFLVALAAASDSFYNGQANLMMTGFLLLGLTAVAEDRWWWAASYLAAATLIKVFPIALAMVLAVLFWRTFPVRFIAALLVGLILPFATQRPTYVANQTVHWFHHVVESVELNRDRLRSLDKLLEMTCMRVEPKLFLVFGAIAGAGVLAVGLWSRSSGANRRDLLLRVAAWFLTWVLMFGPSTENSTYSILAPIIAWALVDSSGHLDSWRRWVWILISMALMGLSGGDLGDPLKRSLGDFCWTTVGGMMFQFLLITDLFKSRPPRI